jgi:AbrB family looped-hinge helix DNA binding protein
LETEVVENQAEEAEVVVTKKGQTTIPVKLRRKYKIEEGTKLSVIDTKEGILYKPKKTIWDRIGAYAEFGTPEEVKKELDKLRHENE